MGFSIRYITVLNTAVSQRAVLSGVLLDDCQQHVSTVWVHIHIALRLFAEEGGCCYRKVPMARIQIARWLFDAKCGRCIRGSRSRQESGMSVVESASRAANPSLLGHWSTAPRSKFHFLPTFSDHSVFQFGRQLNQLSYVNSNN